ncbi:MAG: hypothetical protein ACJ77K_02505 [Bacteroidia bacterium]
MKIKKLLLLAACCSFSMVNAQTEKAFHKGTITIDPNIGFAVYGTKIHQESDQQYWNGTSIATKRVKNDTTDGAGSTIYGLRGEYGVRNWLGIGARFSYSNYIEEQQHDTVFCFPDWKYYSYKPKVRGIDFGLDVNFHLVKAKRFDMPICLTMGYSNFKYWQNNPNEACIGQQDNGNAGGKDNGMYYGILLCPKIYFGKSQMIGVAFHIGYLGYNYKSISFHNNSDDDLNDNNNWSYHLKGNGFNIGIGVSIKLPGGDKNSASVH